MAESGLTEDLFAHTLQQAREANDERDTHLRVIMGALPDATPENIHGNGVYLDSPEVQS